MKPRWTIDRARFSEEHPWWWTRRDRSGGASLVGCVCHHSWTKIVRRFEVKP